MARKWLPILGCICFIATSAGFDTSAMRCLRSEFFSAVEPIFSNSQKFIKNNQCFVDEEPKDITPKQNSTYDFIVIGAGSAGSAIAARLSEVKNATVLLIEAGDHESLNLDIPGMISANLNCKDINWGYKSEPSDNYCRGMNNHSCNLNRGKVMGGSSVLNYMIVSRGRSQDYDEWAKLGNFGWSYKDVLPYFKKIEDFHIPQYQNDRAQHGTGGPVYVSPASDANPLTLSIIEGFKELGHKVVDYNAQKGNGISIIQTNIKNGSRMSMSGAYLHPIRHRRNLFVTKRSLVKKVIIHKRTKIANGVEFIKEGVTRTVRARKEVILSAGAIGSPQILMLSGVGHTDHLKKLGIKVIQDAPVGDNLMDHSGIIGLTFVDNRTVPMTDMNALVKQYITNRTGALSTNPIPSLLFTNADDPTNQTSDPNIELIFSPNSISTNQVQTTALYNLRNSFFEASFPNLEGKSAWDTFSLIIKPKSRGWIRLRKPDINSDPIIVPNYFDDPEDMRVIIKAIRLASSVSKTKALRKYGTHIYDRPMAGCELHSFDSDDYWECAVRALTLSIYHYSGTCKMGSRNDTTAVVDPTLRVIGIKRLRVADASIMPVIPAGHTNIPTIMIGEKLADMVKRTWGYL